MKEQFPEERIASMLGKNIRRKRKLRGLSQAILAELCEIHPTYMGHIERGTRLPSLTVIFRIASALESDAHQLIMFRSTPKVNDKKTDRCLRHVGEEPLCNILNRLLNSRDLRRKLGTPGIFSKTRNEKKTD